MSFCDLTSRQLFCLHLIFSIRLLDPLFPPIVSFRPNTRPSYLKSCTLDLVPLPLTYLRIFLFDVTCRHPSRHCLTRPLDLLPLLCRFQALRISLADLGTKLDECAKVAQAVDTLIKSDEELDMRMRREHAHKW